MKELSIGDIDIIGGKIARCEKQLTCDGCAFFCCELPTGYACVDSARRDDNYVIFREVSLSSLTAERELICKACAFTGCSRSGCDDTADIDRQIAKVKELMI